MRSARAPSPDDKETNIIRIDGPTRNNAGTSIDDRVNGRKADTKMLQYLHEQYSLSPHKPVLFAAKVGEKQQPLHMCISKEYKSSLKQYLEKDKHRVMKWMSDNSAHWLDFDTLDESFRNFNTLEEVNTY